MNSIQIIILKKSKINIILILRKRYEANIETIKVTLKNKEKKANALANIFIMYPINC